MTQEMGKTLKSAVQEAENISEFGGWKSYLKSQTLAAAK
jgi:hypothetical protein